MANKRFELDQGIKVGNKFTVDEATGDITTSGNIVLQGTGQLQFPGNAGLAIEQGGTGAATQQAAITALTGTQTTGYYLRSNGTNAVLAALNPQDLSAAVPLIKGGTGQTSQQAAINALVGTQNSGYYLRSDGVNATMSPLTLNDITGTVPITQGGTGATTAAAAFSALAPSQTGNSGKFLTTNGSATSWTTIDSTLPVQTGNSGKVLTTNGTATSWGTVAYSSITGTPTLATVATTGSYNDLTDKPSVPSLAGYATETYVTTQVSNLVAGADGALDTLKELADALGGDANFSTTVTTALGNRLRVDVANQALTTTQKSNAATNLGLATSATTDTTNATNITSGTLSNSRLSAIPNSALANNAITVNGSSISLGSSATIKASTTNALTIGTGLSGASFDGSSNVTVAIDSTVTTLSGLQTLTNKTLTSPTVNAPVVKGERTVVSDLGTLVTGTTTVDLSTAQIFTATVGAAAAVTFAFSNAPSAGQSQMIVLRLTNAGAGTLIWPAGTKYAGGAMTTLTAAGIDMLGVFYDTTTSTYMVFILGKDMK